ncbi:GNAT family N-acetyltransferase [Streptomyces alkaliphilus]|uniref:GNAT family N-acetyltransferase n=1 Tax=Streptomyces alkaliphilus TaxID=1472722 RepID=UPI0011801FCE|nr:GNAT family N-acetyltransferase [Streptomyces alkaliphilus]
MWILGEAEQVFVDAFGGLLPQLSSMAEPLDREAIDRMVSGEATTLPGGRFPEAIIGVLAPGLLPLPSGLRARAEDGVVDGTGRGRGVAGLLTVEVLRIAREAGARTVDLTPRPDREVAKRWCERPGFRFRQPTVHRFRVGG